MPRNTSNEAFRPKRAIERANKLLDEYVHRLGSSFATGDLIEFGPAFKTAEPERLISSLVAHRFHSKFSVPDPAKAAARKAKCFADWIAYEEVLKNYNFYDSIRTLPKEDVAVLYKARIWLDSALSKKRWNPSKWPVEFTPGETFLSSGGDTNVRSKLRNVSHWTITWDALHPACELIKQHGGYLLRTLVTHVCLKYSEYRPSNLTLSEWVAKEAENATYAYIRWAMLDLCTFVNGARGATVPKNVEDDRFINCEPLWNVILQRALSVGHLIPCLAAVGNDIPNGQARHKAMIASDDVATIDLKKASDSNHFDCVRFFLPKRVFEYVNSTRSYCTYLGDRNDLQEIVNFKISPMGNGFTFEIMTLILLSVCRQLDHTSSVYGDDIIIKNDQADRLIRILSALGYATNMKKTFINSHFRESCGSFFLDGVGYLTSFDFHYCESLADVYSTVNKISLVINHHGDINGLGHLRRCLLGVVPAFAKGPPLPENYFSGFERHGIAEKRVTDAYVEVPSWAKTHATDDRCRRVYQSKKSQYANILEQYYKCQLVGCVSLLEWKPSGPKLKRRVLMAWDVGAYLKNGRQPHLGFRGKGRFVTRDFLVTSSGLLIREAIVRFLRIQDSTHKGEAF